MLETMQTRKLWISSLHATRAIRGGLSTNGTFCAIVHHHIWRSKMLNFYICLFGTLYKLINQQMFEEFSYETFHLLYVLLTTTLSPTNNPHCTCSLFSSWIMKKFSSYGKVIDFKNNFFISSRFLLNHITVRHALHQNQ